MPKFDDAPFNVGDRLVKNGNEYVVVLSDDIMLYEPDQDTPTIPSKIVTVQHVASRGSYTTHLALIREWAERNADLYIRRTDDA